VTGVQQFSRTILAETRPDALLPDLAASLNNLGLMLSNLGRREEALYASQEAADIRRRLAETRPDAFLPDLATSLWALGRVLAGMERHEAAADALHEGLMILAPFAEVYREALGVKADTIRSEYLQACKHAGIAPDAPLLERVARALHVDAREDGGAAENAQSHSPGGGNATPNEQSAPPDAKRPW
jgi:tetratricopeptide (TPR) repeat protein